MEGRAVALAAGVAAAAERLRAARTVAIILPDLPRLEVVTAALVVAGGLERLGKTITVFGARSVPARLPALGSAFRSWQEPLREFIISFDLSRSPIRELKYERDENRLDIILSPTGSRIRREDIGFRHGPLRYDAALALGVASPAAAAANLAEVPELLLEVPVINLDADPSNEGYGEENVVVRHAAETLAEVVADLLERLGAGSGTPDDATLLLASLAASTDGLHPAVATPRAYRLAAALCDRGADPRAAASLLIATRSRAEEQLAARAIARSRIAPESGAAVALLTREDFEKTGADPDAVAFVLARVQRQVAGGKRTLIFWQDPAGGRVHAAAALAADEPPEPTPPWQPAGAGSRHLVSAETFATFRDAQGACAQFATGDTGGAVE